MKNLDSEKLVNKKFLARRGLKLLRVFLGLFFLTHAVLSLVCIFVYRLLQPCSQRGDVRKVLYAQFAGVGKL
jgi:hypothetical protein